MMEYGEWCRRVYGALARDLEVYVLAANAGAELSPAELLHKAVPYDPNMLIGSWTGGSGEWDGPGLVLPSGWAAWYAAAEELP